MIGNKMFISQDKTSVLVHGVGSLSEWVLSRPVMTPAYTGIQITP